MEMSCFVLPLIHRLLPRLSPFWKSPTWKIRGNPYLDLTSVHPDKGVLRVSVTQMQQVAGSNKSY